MKSNNVNVANVEVLPVPNVANCQFHKGGNQWYRKLGLATLATLATFSAAMAAEQNVRLMPSPFLDNTLRERRYLESLDPRALTRMFRVTSGLQKLTDGEGTILYLGGWEDPEIEVRGHTCGHWLSGMASLYELTRDETVKARSAEVVRILAECQAANGDGYVSAFPRKLIDKAIRGEPAWAPWYTLHKILAGLLDQYQCCGNAQALAVARGMGEWAAAKVLPLSAEQAATMRKREYGGIGEALWNLGLVTGEEKFKKAAAVFHDETIYGPLDGKHANTLIPKVIADARAGELERPLAFWRDVMDHYMYAPGCVSTKEKFRGPDRQSEFLTGLTGESCCTYNLLKLSRILFAATGDAAFADYQERAAWNHILGQMEPIDGHLTYFMPVMTGSYKLQNRSNDSFWCCVGSAMESHTRYQRLVFAERNGELYVNQFIPAEIEWRGIRFRLETHFPAEEKARLVVVDGGGEVTIHIRRPFWATLAGSRVPRDRDGRAGAPRTPNETASVCQTHSRNWKKGDVIEIPLPCRFRTETLPGGETAVFYGPILMAARLGVEGMRKDALRSTNYYTHDYTVPENLRSVKFEPPETWTRISAPAPVKKGALHFTEPSFRTPSGLVMAPYWSIHGERLAVYFEGKTNEEK